MKRDYILCPNCGGEVYRHDTMYLHDAELIDIFEMRKITPREVVAGLIGIVGGKI
jgi:hypothetical protein